MTHQPMRIGVLGGTFDPVHEGHLTLARAAKAQYSLTKVVFIPANIPPHKMVRQDMASARDRCEMVSLALQGEPGFEVSTIEIDRPGISYSIDTLKSLRKLYPEAHFYMILGADAFGQFETWHDADEIRRQVIFLVASRPGSEIKTENFSGEVYPVKMPNCEAASTDIRAGVHDPSFSSATVSQRVLDYIRKNRLYR